MWDIFDRLKAVDSLAIDLLKVPVIQNMADAMEAIRQSRAKRAAAVWHGQYGSLVGLLTGLRPDGCRIISLRGSDIYWRYGPKPRRLAAFVRIIMSWIGCLRSHAIIVMSGAMADKVRGWPFLSRKRIHLLVDPAGSMFWPEEAVDIASRLLSQPHSVLIASLVDDNPIKRLAIVEDAVRLCQSAGMGVSLEVLSGKTRNEVREAIARADCVALASTHEGWPNIIKESLLLNTPFVATNVSDLASYAQQDSRMHIVSPTPLDFAMAWVDQIAAQILNDHGVPDRLSKFHPDVCALKHVLLYMSFRK